MSVKGLYDQIVELEARFALDNDELPYSHRVLFILNVYGAMLSGVEESTEFDEGDDPNIDAHNLYQRIVDLEERFDLNAEGLFYSQRTLAIIQVYESRFFGESPLNDEKVAEAVVAVTGESVEAKLANIKSAIGDLERSGPVKPPQSMEEAMSGIQGILEGGSNAAPEKENDADANTDGKSEFELAQEKVRGSNVSEQTLLATDYLNHFNEIVMTIEMIPDMPEFLEEAKEWKPKTYKEHFQGSSIADKDLAIEVYDHVPAKYRDPFEKTIGQVDHLIAVTLEKLEGDLKRGDSELLRENATSLSRVIQRLMDTAAAIIHGSENTMDQEEIDALLF